MKPCSRSTSQKLTRNEMLFFWPQRLVKIARLQGITWLPGQMMTMLLLRRPDARLRIVVGVQQFTARVLLVGLPAVELL